jgi:UMF1 family MFS transporter
MQIKPAWSRGEWSWAAADLAREPFFTIVLSLIFPPFFVAWVVGDPVRGTTLWGYSLATASILLVLLSPLAGAAADVLGRRKPWIAACIALAVLALISLWFATARPGMVLWVMACCISAQVFVELSRVFTDSMMLRVTRTERVGALSGLAVGLGFAGSFIYLLGVLLAGSGLSDDESQAGLQRAATLLCGFWLMLFMLPLFRFAPDEAKVPHSLADAASDSLRRLRSSLRDVVRLPGIGRFLVARMAYWDGVMALFSFIAILAASHLGWRAAELSVFGLAGLLAGSLGGLLGGALDLRIGPRNTLLATLLVMLCTAAMMQVMLPDLGAETTRESLLDQPGDAVFLGLAVIASACLGLLTAWVSSSVCM